MRSEGRGRGPVAAQERLGGGRPVVRSRGSNGTAVWRYRAIVASPRSPKPLDEGRSTWHRAVRHKPPREPLPGVQCARGGDSTTAPKAKDDLHRLVDALPDTATETPRRFLTWIIEEEGGTDPLPLSEAEWRGVRQGEAEFAAGDHVALGEVRRDV